MSNVEWSSTILTDITKSRIKSIVGSSFNYSFKILECDCFKIYKIITGKENLGMSYSCICFKFEKKYSREYFFLLQFRECYLYMFSPFFIPM